MFARGKSNFRRVERPRSRAHNLNNLTKCIFDEDRRLGFPCNHNKISPKSFALKGNTFLSFCGFRGLFCRLGRWSSNSCCFELINKTWTALGKSEIKRTSIRRSGFGPFDATHGLSRRTECSLNASVREFKSPLIRDCNYWVSANWKGQLCN